MAPLMGPKGVTGHPATQPVAAPVPWPAPPALPWSRCHRARRHKRWSSAQGSAPWSWPENQTLLLAQGLHLARAQLLALAQLLVRAVIPSPLLALLLVQQQAVAELLPRALARAVRSVDLLPPLAAASPGFVSRLGAPAI